MDGSSAERIAPAGLNVLAVFDNAGNCRISAGVLEHLGAVFAIGLRVAIDERNSLRIVMVPGLLTVGASRFRVNNQSQRSITSIGSG